MPYNTDELNSEFSADGHISYAEGPGRLVIARIENASAAAEISLYAAHVLSYVPRGSEPILWVSEASDFEVGKPIRGGIPVCWPWFGAHPTHSDLPSHGIARISEWTPVSAEAVDDETTVLTLALASSEASLAVWPFAFELSLQITVGRALKLDLTTRNTGSRAMTLTQALHTYFSVSAIENISVDGFDGREFINTVGGANAIGTQEGPVRFSEETDLIFFDCQGAAEIIDEGARRRIRITKEGSNSAVVWNPWAAKSIRMPDFGDDEYHGMVCVETTNAPGDEVVIDPDSEHTLTAIISV